MTRRILRTLTTFLVAGAAPALAQSPAREFSLEPSTYLQLDWRGFRNWDVTPDSGRLNRDTLEVRRLRFGLDTHWKRLAGELSLDPLDDDGVAVKDAYVRVAMAGGLRLQAGQFKLPTARSYETSARRIGFLERSALAMSLAARRDSGVQLDGGTRVRWAVGLFAGDNVGDASRAGLTTAGRLDWRVARDLTAGAFGSLGRTNAVDAQAANGVELRSASGYRFAQAVYVDGRRTRAGGNFRWSPGTWLVEGEAIRVQDTRHGQGLDREDLPSAAGTGAAVTLRREFRRPSRTRGWLRPMDAGVRYDWIRFDDTGATGTDSVRPRATNIRARAYDGATIGATWRATSYARILGNLSFERYTDVRSAPNAGKAGAYLAAGLRFQLEWR